MGTTRTDGIRKSHRLRTALAAAARLLLVASATAAALVARPAVCAGQDFLPSRPITLWDDRLVIGGDASIAFGSDDSAYFNTLDYDHNALNLTRLALSAEFRPDDHIAVVTQLVDQIALRTEPFDVQRNVFRVYALFVRVRPWRDKPFDVQAGRIPPVFGAFARQDYGADNPLIGLPLAYQYPTTLRTDALPASTADLLRVRGRGWYVPEMPIGNQDSAEGLPIVSPQRWDTGVQAHWGDGAIELSGALTQGTLSNPLVQDDNGGKSISGRVALKPTAGLTIGLSGARGAFLSDSTLQAVPAADRSGRYTQRAFGADVEYSRGYWLVRGETIVSLWRVPAIDAPRLDDSLRAWSTAIEGRWKLSPRWYLAARVDRLGFNDVADPQGGTRAWDADVYRVEAGGGYTLTRNVRLKLSYQHDRRDSANARFRHANLVASQLVYWF